MCPLYLYSDTKRFEALGNLFVLLGALLQAFPPASNPKAMYLAGRFLIGFGSNISNGTCPLLITEVAHPRHRGRITTIYNTLWYLGAIVAAWTTFGTLVGIPNASNLQWRLPTGLQCAMPGIQLLALYLVPESPRFHIARNKPEKARQMLIKYHGNGVETSFVQWEYEEISTTLQLEKQAAAESGWKEMVRTPGNRKRCILIIATAIFSQCSGNSLVSYYLVQILESIGMTNPTHQSLFNGGLTIWCFLVALAFAFAVDKFGRRTLFLTAAVGMLISFSIWTASAAMYEKTGKQAYGNTVLAMIFCFYTVAGLAWPGLTVSYTVEILPYNIRAKGLTLCFCFTALSGVFNQYVNPIGLKNLGWKFYFVYIAVLVIQCIMIYFYYVETKGLPLEEISRVIDGDRAASAVVANTLAHEGIGSASRRASVVDKKQQQV